MFSDKRFGLSGSLIAAVRGVLVEEKDQGIVDAKKLKGGKTKVDLEPKTDDDTRDYDDKKSMKEGKEHTVPKTEKEKKLASLAFPKDKITHKDVLVGRGVLAKEEKDSPESIITDFKDRQAYLGHRKQEADHNKRANKSKGVAQQHHYNMASQHNDSANDILDRYRKTNEEVNLDSLSEEDLQEEMTIDKLKKQGFKKVSSSNNGWTHHYAHPDKEHGYKIEYGPQPDTIKSIKKTKSIYEEVDLESLTEEDLEEALKKSQPAGEWVKDFVHSKDPKFAGKSKKKRMQMALGAYYAKQRNEEVEEIEEKQLDELKKSTLGSYIKKAAQDRGHLGIDVGAAGDTNSSQRKKNLHKMKKRMMGIHRASDRLTKEELERIETIAQSLDEDKPTIVSAPIRGANQDQSGENTKNTSSAYTISDSKKMRKEEVELDEAKVTHRVGAAATKAVSGKVSDDKEAGKSKWFELDKKEKELSSRSDADTGKYAKELNKITKAKTNVATKHGLNAFGEEVELDEAKRGRPKKNPTPDDEQDEHEHVIMQLRKVVSTHGALPVKHLDGKSTKITPQLAQHALNKHAALKTAAEKQDFEQKLHKSHDSMKSALG